MVFPKSSHAQNQNHPCYEHVFICLYDDVYVFADSLYLALIGAIEDLMTAWLDDTVTLNML